MKNKYERMIDEQKRNSQNELARQKQEYEKKIAQLEADLKEARKGFEHEREILEKKRADMQADYEK